MMISETTFAKRMDEYVMLKLNGYHLVAMSDERKRQAEGVRCSNECILRPANPLTLDDA